MDKLVEIKKGQSGTGLLIENDGYISIEDKNNKELYESYKKLNEDINDGGFHCPYPFVVSAVFQKYGIENANGRIYPESVLRREVDKYMTAIKEKRAIGECYTPRAMVLAKEGWKSITDVKEGDEVLTLNTTTNEVEYQNVEKKIEYDYNGDMCHLKGDKIDDLVTPNHGYPIYSHYGDFNNFYTAHDIYSNKIDHPDSNFIPADTTKPLEERIYLDEISISVEKYNGKVMCIEVPNHTFFVMDGHNCHWSKNCNHPADSVIDLSRTAMNILELHWENHTLVGKLEILTSPGYRKYGIISCQGDQVANLILSGIRVGVSSRGMGTVTNRMGVLYVEDNYEIVCWDFVSSPSTPNAWVAIDQKELQPFIESKENNQKSLLNEKINKALSILS